MYSRSFYPEGDGKPTLPENYDGTAFTEAGASQIESVSSPPQESEETAACATGGGGILASLSRSPFLSGLFGTAGNHLKIPSIGLEEILILATAAILFFSKEGDKECALILLFLLFIS